ncbi:MAG TPA: AMP-binding protein [Jatrophihabitans sp.]|nr:AMP-binding protein [Jatrophihabitans sp.]
MSRPAITIGDRSLHRAELFAAAGAVADAVDGAGRVAVEASASLETVVAVLGCLLAGAVAVPVPPDAGPRERAHILSDSAAAPCPPVDVTARSSASRSLPQDGPALLMYTSGTTGAPKGAVISHAAVNACLDGLADAWQWSGDDVLAHGLPLFHVHGLVLGVLGALRAGSPLVHTGRPTPTAYAAAADAGATLFFGVPTVWGRIAGEPSCARALRSARLLVSGSAALPSGVFRALGELAGQGPVERYGMTETLITLAARADEPRRVGRVGRPIRGVEARVRGEPSEIGDLEVRGATLFDGYLHDPAPLTEDGWFTTGDSAELDADGTFRIVGRTRDDLIKTGGYRVGAGEIEAALLDHPAVAEAAVIGVADTDLGQRIVAYVVGSGVGEQQLIDHVARELSTHKRPREVRFVDALPRNAMGKVQKAQLG